MKALYWQNKTIIRIMNRSFIQYDIIIWQLMSKTEYENHIAN